MRKVSQMKTGAILSYLALALSISITLLYTPYMMKTLGVSEYGVYSLVNSTIAYLTLLGFGFETAIVRYTTKYRTEGNKEGERKLHGMFFLLYTVIGIIAFGLGMLLTLNVPVMFSAKLTASEIAITQKLMFLASIDVALTFPFSIFAAITTSYEKFVFAKTMLVIKNVLKPLLMVTVLALGRRSAGMMIVAAFITVFFGLVNVSYCFKKLKIKFIFRGFDKSVLKEITVFSFYIFLGIIVDRIYWSTGQVLLGMLAGAAAISMFTLGVQLNNYYMQLSSAISGMFLPRITAICTREHTNHELTNVMIKVGRLQFFVLALALSGFILVGRQFITIWLGSDFNEVYNIALVLFLPITIPLVQNVGISILQAKNIHAFRAIAYVIIAICNIGLSIPLINIFGAMGSAISIAISYTIGQIIIMNIYYYKVVGLDIPRFWRSIGHMLPAVIVPMLVQYAFMYFVPIGGVIGFAVYGGTYCVLYGLCMMSFGLNNRERKMFLRPVKKVLAKIL